MLRYQQGECEREIDVLLIAHFCSDFDDKGNNRFNYLAEMLSKNGCNVELVTTNYSHDQKDRRNQTKNLYSYQVTMLHEPGYTKNVSLKRFYSHYIMGRNLKKYLKTRKKPDVIYCAIPSLDVADVAAKYAEENSIRFIIDVQDVWPEVFKMVFNIPLVSDALLYPMKRKADYVYRAADEIVAVSQTYADRALSVNKKCEQGYSVFLGTELIYFDKLGEENKLMTKPYDEIWLAYIGTLGHSYDIKCVIDALKLAKHDGIDNIKLVVMGDGPLKDDFEKYAMESSISYEFTGRLDYAKMVGILNACDIAINPITKGSAQSIINKVGDYAAASLPVINNQECVEYRELLETYAAGLNCNNSDAVDMADKIMEICRDEKLRESMSNNSRRLFEEKFDRTTTYPILIEKVNAGR